MRYRTIVADPPWDVKAGPRSLHDPGERSRALTYSTMDVKEIAALPVGEWAARSAHLYIWTINAYVEQTYGIARAWGFDPKTLLVWAKAPKGRGLGGRFSTATEYILFCSRGSFQSAARVDRNWWQWKRSQHSAKPEAFLDIVEQVSPGPYLEMFARRARFGWDYWGRRIPRHRGVGGMIAVIVPTVNRADMLEALVANIHQATLNDHQIYLLMEEDDLDSSRVAKGLDTVDVFGDFGSCSVAVNAGYRASTEPFVAVVNDDCYFHANWDAHALQYFTDQVHIVGMNDGHGDTKCFPMVRRSYIEQHSGVFDKPNTIFHTYKSQGPDTEFAFYAMLRGVWADAPYAIVEHRNWRAGADPNHPNYLKARDTITEDLAEYNRRWPLWDPEQRMPPGVPTVEAR